VNHVIDASVFIKFFIPEILPDNAGEVLSQTTGGKLLLCAPDLVYPEARNILWKKHRRQELTPEELDEIVNAVIALPISTEPTRLVMPLAVSIATAGEITVYDAVYVATARIHKTRMVTADRKLVNALSNTEFRNDVHWLGSEIG
jgi:predicted nucleic acid-binding protein